MESTKKESFEAQLNRAVAATPGAVAPTGGAVPEDATGKRSAPEHDVDELVDAVGLLLRAARDLDPDTRDADVRALESESEALITALQELENRGGREVRQRAAAVAESTRRELVLLIGRTLSSLRSSLVEDLLDREEKAS